jgi:hypothetical protein
MSKANDSQIPSVGPSSQLLHNRAAESAKETRQSIVTLSAGSLAVFFLALTSKIEPPLSDPQKATVIIALVAMAAAIFAGLWSAYSDAQWSFFWAKERTQVEEMTSQPNISPDTYWRNQKNRWHRHKRWSEKAALISFTLGVFVASIYIALRAFWQHA